jgi:hypothetical protein
MQLTKFFSLKLITLISLIILEISLILFAIWVRLPTYLALLITNPLHLRRELPQGLPTTVNEFELQFDNIIWIAPILLFIGILIHSNKPSLNNGVLPTAKKENGSKNALFVLFIIASIRLLRLIGSGIEAEADYDEGVNVFASLLFLQGYAPHQDYFFTHPPVAIYNFIPAALFNFNGETVMWLARFITILWTVGSCWLLFLIGSKLQSATAGIIAMLIMGLDPLSMFIGRQAMLEHPLVFFVLLALWALLKHEDTPNPKKFIKIGNRYLIANPYLWLSGFGLATAILSKLQAAPIIVAVFLYLLFMRRWLDFIKLIFISSLFGLLFLLPVIVRGGLEMFNQLILFQLVRFESGYERFERLNSYSINFKLTSILVFLGIAGWFVRFLRGENVRPFLMIFVFWLAFMQYLFYTSKSFYPHYLLLFLPVYAIAISGISGWQNLLSKLNFTMQRVVLTGLLVLLFPSILSFFVEIIKTNNYEETVLAGYVKSQSDISERVHFFRPVINLYAERGLTRDSEGKFLLDTYGMLIYVASDIKNKPLSESLRSGSVTSGRDVINSPKVHAYLIDILKNNQILMLEKNFEYLATPVLDWLSKNYTIISENEKVVIYAKKI